MIQRSAAMAMMVTSFPPDVPPTQGQTLCQAGHHAPIVSSGSAYTATVSARERDGLCSLGTAMSRTVAFTQQRTILGSLTE